jgi:hypothetical protein
MGLLFPVVYIVIKVHGYMSRHLPLGAICMNVAMVPQIQTPMLDQSWSEKAKGSTNNVV